MRRRRRLCTHGMRNLVRMCRDATMVRLTTSGAVSDVTEVPCIGATHASTSGRLDAGDAAPAPACGPDM